MEQQQSKDKSAAAKKTGSKTQPVKSAAAPVAGKPDEFAYKFKPEIKQQVYEYLQTRPMDDVEEVIVAMFETEDPDPYYKTEGIQMLSELLRKKCPRKDAKRFFELFQKDSNLLKFKVSYGAKPGEQNTMSAVKEKAQSKISETI